MTLVALLSSIVISSASLAWGYSQRGFGSFAVWVLVFGAVWLFAVFQDWKWYSWIALACATVLSALGLWFSFIPGWMFAGGIFALFAWDMFDFRQRLRLMADDDDKRGIERRHILRISLLALIGMALASLTMLVRVQFTLEWSALLVIIALLGLGQLVGWLKK